MLILFEFHGDIHFSSCFVQYFKLVMNIFNLNSTVTDTCKYVNIIKHQPHLVFLVFPTKYFFLRRNDTWLIYLKYIQN